MAQRFLHREQDMRVGACLDMDQTVRMQTGEMECRSEKIAPAQAPDYRPIQARQQSGDEDRRRGIVGQFGTAGYFMQGSAGDPATGKMAINRSNTERQGVVSAAVPLDCSDAGAQIVDG